MAVQHFEPVKAAIDGTLGVGAVTSPFWLALLESGLTIFMLVGGAALLVLRLLIAWREWQDGKSKK